jgi:hypothetical protein
MAGWRISVAKAGVTDECRASCGQASVFKCRKDDAD